MDRKIIMCDLGTCSPNIPQIYTKPKGARTDLTSAQNEQKFTTAEVIAKEYGVGQATIRRDAEFSAAVDCKTYQKPVQNSSEQDGFTGSSKHCKCVHTYLFLLIGAYPKPCYSVVAVPGRHRKY